MPSKSLIGVFVSAYDKNRLETFCKDLSQCFPNSVYMIQYMVKNIPLKSIIKRVKKKHNGLEVLIIGNTNKSFGTTDDFDYIEEKAKKPFFRIGIIDLRCAEETGTGKILKDTVAETFNMTKELVENNLKELAEEKN